MQIIHLLCQSSGICQSSVIWHYIRPVLSGIMSGQCHPALHQASVTRYYVRPVLSGIMSGQCHPALHQASVIRHKICFQCHPPLYLFPVSSDICQASVIRHYIRPVLSGIMSVQCHLALHQASVIRYYVRPVSSGTISVSSVIHHYVCFQCHRVLCMSAMSSSTMSVSSVTRHNRSILVMWLEYRLLDTEVDRSNPGMRMLCP